MPSTLSNEAMETNWEGEISPKIFSPRFDLPQENIPNRELIDKHEIEPTTNNTYMPRSKISFLQVVTSQVLMMHINVSTTLWVMRVHNSTRLHIGSSVFAHGQS